MKQKKISIRFILILLGGFTLLVRYLFSLNPSITEIVYSRGIFQLVRYFIDYTIALLPFPLIYLLLILLLFFDARLTIRWFKKKKQNKQEKKPFKIRTLNGFSFFGAVLGAIIFLFYFLWAFNYERLPIESHLKIKPVPLGADEIRNESAFALQKMIRSRQSIPGIEKDRNGPLDNQYLPGDWESEVRHSMKRVLESMNFPTSGRVRVKRLWSAGLMMNLGGSGLYFPFTGEAYIPTNLTPIEIPFLAAHEMAHGYGFSQEGTANFLAYLACSSSQDPFVNYSGDMVYFSHISRELKKISTKEFEALQKKIPSGIIADYIKKYNNWKKYRGWLMHWGAKVYDSYLKTQGVREGIKSYNRLLILVKAWQKTQEK